MLEPSKKQVEAVRYGQQEENHTRDFSLRPIWLLLAFKDNKLHFENGALIATTVDGDIVVEDGDYIVKEESDNVYPYPPALFDLSYEVSVTQVNE